MTFLESIIHKLCIYSKWHFLEIIIQEFLWPFWFHPLFNQFIIYSINNLKINAFPALSEWTAELSLSTTRLDCFAHESCCCTSMHAGHGLLPSGQIVSNLEYEGLKPEQFILKQPIVHFFLLLGLVFKDLNYIHMIFNEGFWGNGVKTHVNSKGKPPTTGSSEEDQTHTTASSSYLLSCLGPLTCSFELAMKGQTVHHILQDCSIWRQQKHQLWLQDQSTTNKLWGTAEDLRHTIQFLAA